MLIFDTKKNISEQCRLITKDDLQKSGLFYSKSFTNIVLHLALNTCLVIVLDEIHIYMLILKIDYASDLYRI